MVKALSVLYMYAMRDQLGDHKKVSRTGFWIIILFYPPNDRDRNSLSYIIWAPLGLVAVYKNTDFYIERKIHRFSHNRRGNFRNQRIKIEFPSQIMKNSQVLNFHE